MSDTAPNPPSNAEELLLSGRYQQAVQALDEQLVHSPHDIDLLRTKAGALLASGEHDSALQVYDAILQAQPQNIEVLIATADLLVWLARYQDALPFYDRVIALDSPKTEAFQKKGLALRMLGKGDEALASYDQALKMDPRDARAWWGKGDVFLDQQQPSTAFDCYSKGDETDSERAFGAPAWTERGDRLLDIENPTDALFCYERARQQDPEYVWAWRGMALGFQALGKYEEALKNFEGALARLSEGDSGRSVVWEEKGNVLYDLSRYAEASACYAQVLEVDPGNVVTLINQGLVRQNELKHEDAIAFFDRALANDGERAIAWHSKGVSLGILGRNEEAIECYDRALQLNSESIWTWNNKGFLLISIGKHEAALPCFEKAIEIDRSEVLPWTNKAITLRFLNRYSEAAECLRLAKEVVTDRYSALRDLGSLLGDYMKDPESALEVYQEMLRISSEATAWINSAECLLELGRYEEGRHALLSAQPDEKHLRCIMSFLFVVSYALEGDSQKFDSSFEQFLKTFVQLDDEQRPVVGADNWDYCGLLNAISLRSPDLRTRFLLALAVDLQMGTVEPSKLEFFKSFPSAQRDCHDDGRG
jgi:tetratricopeptide (TPR) repeat protein